MDNIKKITALQKAIKMIESDFKEVITPEDFKVLMEIPEIRNNSKQLFVSSKYYNKNDQLAPRFSGLTIKIGGKLVSLLSREDYRTKRGSKWLELDKYGESIHIDKDFNFDAFKVDIEERKKFGPRGVISYKTKPLQDFDNETIKSINLETLIKLQTALKNKSLIDDKKLVEKDGQTDLQLNELKKQFELLKSIKEEIVSYGIEFKETKRLHSLQKAIKMIESDFKEVITPEDFKVLMEIPEIRNNSKQLFVSSKYYNKNDQLAPRFSGLTIKIGGKLVSLLSREDYRTKRGSKWLELDKYGESIHIDKDFNFDAFKVDIEERKKFGPRGVISYKTKPLQDFDNETMKSLELLELVNLQIIELKTQIEMFKNTQNMIGELPTSGKKR